MTKEEDMKREADRRWLDHYGECGVCVGGAEAAEFHGGVENYCAEGRRLKALAVAESDRLSAAERNER